MPTLATTAVVLVLSLTCSLAWGIPEHESTTRKELETFFALFGESENKIPLKYRSGFTSMQSGKGTRGLTSKTTTFWAWIQGKGWEDSASSISGLLSGQGIPEPESTTLTELETFMALFGEETHQIPNKLLPYSTSMHSSKGTRELVDKVQGFWDLVNRLPAC